MNRIQCTSNQSPSLANQRTANHSPVPVTQRTGDQSPVAVVTRHTSDQSFKSSPPSTVTIPKSTKKLKQISMIKETTKKKKVNGPYEENNINRKTGSVPQDEDKKKKKKPNKTEELKWEDKEKQ